MGEAGGQGILQIWDELQFGLLVHRAVADTQGYSVDLALGFDARARAALADLLSTTEEEKKKKDESQVSGTTRPLLMADAHRRMAVLYAYLEPDSGEERELFATALDLYGGAVRVGSGETLTDEFSEVLTRLEQTLTLRRLGQLEPEDQKIDRGKTNLESLGLLHLVDEIRADAVKSRLSLAQPGKPIEVDEPVRPAASARAGAHLLLAVGLVHRHNGNVDDAERVIRAGRELIEAAHYGLFDQMERHFDRLVVAWAFGLTARDATDRLEALDAAVRRIEEIRGGWQLGSGRSDPTSKPLQAVLTSCLRAVCEIEHPESGWYALRMMEAMRRRHLAGMLRSVRFDRTDSDRIHRSFVIALTDLVSLSEDQQMAGSADAIGLVRHHFTPGPDGAFIASRDTVTVEDFRAELRHAMQRTTKSVRSELISDYFADAFLPQHVDIVSMKAALHGRHAVAYTSVDASTMARAWVDPGGTATADIIDVTDCADRAAELDWRGCGLPDWKIEDEYLGRELRFASENIAEVLSSALLPAEFRRILARTAPQELVIVPDDWLSSVAWPALTDAGGRELIRGADIALVPSVSLLRDDGPWDEGTGIGAAACLDYHGATTWDPLKIEDELRYFPSIGASKANSIGELLNELVASHDVFDWVYIACHGDDPTKSEAGADGTSVGAGLGVELIERDESRVTFLDLLSVPWPRLVTFAGCFTARLNWKAQTGLAPLGLAVSTLASGADTVLGSTDQLDDRSAGLFIGWEDGDRSDEGALGRVRNGTHPVRALADAQRAWLDRGPKSAAPLYWARAVAVTQRLPAPSA